MKAEKVEEAIKAEKVTDGEGEKDVQGEAKVVEGEAQVIEGGASKPEAGDV